MLASKLHRFVPGAGARARVMDYAAYQGAARFPALDGVRAVAILLVITAHLASQGLWGHVHGGNGVTIFFVLSGYLITTLALREESRRGALDLRAFFVRRVCRIYPLYTVVLALYILLILGLGLEGSRREQFAHELPYYAFGFPEHGNFFDPDVPFQVAWSLGIEEKYYIVWPLVGFVLLAGLLRARVMFCVLFCGLILAVQSTTPEARVVFPYVHIMVGCILALLLQDPRWFARLRWLGRGEALAIALAFVVVLDALTGYDTSPLLSMPFTLAVCAALGGLVLAPSSGASRFLSSRPAVFVGGLSYALYLVHQIGLNLLERVTVKYGVEGSVAELFCGLAFGLVLAYLLHLAVELPFIRLGRAFSRRRAVASLDQAASLQPRR